MTLSTPAEGRIHFLLTPLLRLWNAGRVFISLVIGPWAQVKTSFSILALNFLFALHTRRSELHLCKCTSKKEHWLLQVQLCRLIRWPAGVSCLVGI